MTSTGPDDAAREAAQHVADSAEAWEHGAEKATVREHLEQGLAEAGVDMPEGEKDKLVDEIQDGDTTPRVGEATPEDR